MMEVQSKYCYPNTDVLINKLNIKDQHLLDRAEKKLTGLTLGELSYKPITGRFDLKHLQVIHQYIFQDIYDFAGQLREEQISKGHFQFASPLYINAMFRDLHSQLKRENYLHGLDKEKTAERLAYYMAEVNVIHPFREGNGRSTREYIRCLAMANGYTIDWGKLNKIEFLDAIKLSIINTEKLGQLIYQAIEEKERSKEVLKEWKKAKLESNEMG